MRVLQGLPPAALHDMGIHPSPVATIQLREAIACRQGRWPALTGKDRECGQSLGEFLDDDRRREDDALFAVSALASLNMVRPVYMYQPTASDP